MLFEPRDIFEPDLLTGVVELRADETANYDITELAPIEQTQDTEVEITLRAGTQSRIGQFRAVNAATPINVPPGFEQRRTTFPIPILAEKEIIDERLMRLLNSVDTEIGLEAANKIVDSGARLREQNINLTKLMVFQALQDALTITYPSGGSIDVVYGLANGQGDMSASHLLTASVLWSNPAADIIGDIDAWKDVISNDFGTPPTVAWLTTPVLRAMQKNTTLMQMANTLAEPRTPTLAQLQEFLQLTLNIYDQGYLDRAGIARKFMAQNKITLINPGNGNNRTLRVMDGPVSMFDANTGRVTVRNNPGAVTDIWATPDPPVENVRVQTCRMPVMIKQAILTGTVL